MEAIEKKSTVVTVLMTLVFALTLAVAVNTTAGADQALAKGKWYTSYYYDTHRAPKDTVTSKKVVVRGTMHRCDSDGSMYGYSSHLRGKKHTFKLSKKAKFYRYGALSHNGRISKRLAMKQARRCYRGDSLIINFSVKVYKGKVIAVKWFVADDMLCGGLV